MTSKPTINRRNFLKLSGLAAVSLPAVSIIGSVGDQLLAESDSYGGFLVRKHSRENPPYSIDSSVHQRFDAKNCIFGRQIWDDELNERIRNAELVYETGDPGYTQIDDALYKATAFLANYDGTASAGVGHLKGMLNLDSLSMTAASGPVFEDPWDYTAHSPEEVADIVKKAAIFLGASLVGIAPLDERWIYTGYADGMSRELGAIEFTSVEQAALSDSQVAPDEARDLIAAELEDWEGDAIKDVLVELVEIADPELLPQGMPDLSTLPSSVIKAQLPTLMGALPIPLLQAMADQLELGIEFAEIDPASMKQPRYLEDGTLAIPETMKTVIVMAFEMDYDNMEASPTTLSNIGSMDGYARMATTAGQLAQFIRSLGYNALPAGNQAGLSVPMAIDAGLGEMGRHGILITPKYGPRVRLAKVITDLPMAFDAPITFGVEEFCKVCKKCADACPSKAISSGSQTTESIGTISSNPGVKKWPVDGEKCFIGGWIAHGSGCGICIRVCPFNKPEGWLHDATRVLIGAGVGPLDDLLVRLDDASGYGGDEPKLGFWDSNNHRHIKD